MQKPHLPVQAAKLPCLIGGSIEERTETSVNLGGPITMVPFLHQGYADITRKLWVWRAQKCIPLVGAETPLTPSHEGSYRAENGNLRKLGWTYRHCTVLPPRQCLYQKEAKGMESPEMYSTPWCRNPHTCAGLPTTMSQGLRYRAENRNLCKLGLTYRHGTMLPPK